jgi:hypothetical protein
MMYGRFSDNGAHSAEWFEVAKNFLKLAFASDRREAKCPCNRKDLAYLCDCPNMEAKPNARGNLRRTKDLYCLKPIERKTVLRWIKTLKVPDRYATNIKRAVNVSTGKLNGLKSHDYHIFIERLMSIMFRGYFKPDLWKMFAELSYFYR